MEPWPVRGDSSPPVCAREERSDFPPVSGGARVSAVGPSPVVSLQEPRDSPGDSRVVGTPATPGDGIARVGAAPPVPVHVPRQRRLGVATPPLSTGWRPAVPRPLLTPPGLLVAPAQRRVRLATPAPRAAWWAPRCVPRLARLVTTDRGAVGAPSADHRVDRLEETSLGVPPRAAPHGPHRALRPCQRLPARVDERLVAARGRRGVWPQVDAQAVTPCLPRRHLHGRGEAGRARVQGHAPAGPVCRPPRLPSRPHVTRGRSDEQRRRRAHHRRTAATGNRSRARLCPSVPCPVGSPGRGGAPVRGPRGGGTPGARVAPAHLPPGGARPPPRRRRLERASPGGVGEASAAGGAVRRQHPCRWLVALARDGAPRLPGTPARATAVAGGFQRCVPCWRQPVCDPRVRRAIGHGRHPPGTRRGRAGCGTLHPTAWRRVARAGQVWPHVQPLVGRQRRDPLDAGCRRPLLRRRDVPSRSPGRRPGAEHPWREPADGPVLPTRGGSVAAVWALPHRACARDPATGVPWIHRRAGRVQPGCPPTHPAPVHPAGRTSASPLAFPGTFAA